MKKWICLSETKWVIFDLDGTLADIEDRRKQSTVTDRNGKVKLNWSTFFDPKKIEYDKPNHSVIRMAQVLAESGHSIAIFSGRSNGTELSTKSWLDKHKVPYHILKMRPMGKMQYTPDDVLKQMWLDELFPGDEKESIVAVFDDRNKVVDMWRKNGLPCFQVAPGDF